jgi:hypothetical protein
MKFPPDRQNKDGTYKPYREWCREYDRIAFPIFVIIIILFGLLILGVNW